jgi:membrane fusion protein (multidrug efflux system)
MKRPLVLTVIALVVVFGGIFGFIFGKKALIAKYLASYTPPPVAVVAEAVREERWDRSIIAVGTLKAAQGVDIATEVAGTVKRVLFEPGQSVAKGDELLALDDTVEVATLKSLLAQRRLAEINFERDQRLLQNKAISRTDYDKTEAVFKDVGAQVEKTEAIIARKHIRAPFAGRIGIPLVDEGQYVNEGQSLVTLQALDTLDVDFTLPEQQLPLLFPGQRIRCTVQAYPDRAFDGAIVAVDAKVDANTRNAMVRARVPNTALALLPGMFVSVEVVVEEAVPVLTVPETALSYNLYGDSVFVVVPASTGEGLRVERRYVGVGEKRDRRVSLRDGVKAGERIVTAGALKLDNGAAVVLDTRERSVPGA